MYNNISSSAGAGAGAGLLAATGANSLMESVWLGLAAFALVAAGTALMRIVPRRDRELVD